MEDLLGGLLGLIRGIIAVEPCGESRLVVVPESIGRARKDLCALLQAVDVVDTQKTEADVFASVVLFRLLASDFNLRQRYDSYLVPSELTTTTRKALEIRLGKRVLGQVDIALELEDSVRGVHNTKSLLVIQSVPHTRCGILRITSTGRVDNKLLRSCVGAQESDQAVWANRLVLEKLDERVGIAKCAGEKTTRSRHLAVLATNPRADTGSEGADDGSNVGAHLDEIGHAYRLEAELVVVFVVDLRVDGVHILKTLVLTTGEFTSENDGAISTTTKLLSLQRPGASIVEAHSNGLSRPLRTSARSALEYRDQIIRDVLPHAAGILTTLAAIPSRDVAVSIEAFRLALTEQDRLDGLAIFGELVGGGGSEVAKELVGVEVIAGC